MDSCNEIDIKDPFIAQKKAIEYVLHNPDGDKFSFAAGFEYAMKIANIYECKSIDERRD